LTVSSLGFSFAYGISALSHKGVRQNAAGLAQRILLHCAPK